MMFPQRVHKIAYLCYLESSYFTKKLNENENLGFVISKVGKVIKFHKGQILNSYLKSSTTSSNLSFIFSLYEWIWHGKLSCTQHFWRKVGQARNNFARRATCSWATHCLRKDKVALKFYLHGANTLENLGGLVGGGGFICTFSLLISLSFTFQSSKFNYSSSSQCCWTRMAVQMIECCQFRCQFAIPQKR